MAVLSRRGKFFNATSRSVNYLTPGFFKAVATKVATRSHVTPLAYVGMEPRTNGASKPAVTILFGLSL
jgi:hypothetical protein